MLLLVPVRDEVLLVHVGELARDVTEISADLLVADQLGALAGKIVGLHIILMNLFDMARKVGLSSKESVLFALGAHKVADRFPLPEHVEGLGGHGAGIALPELLLRELGTRSYTI